MSTMIIRNIIQYILNSIEYYRMHTCGARIILITYYIFLLFRFYMNKVFIILVLQQ
jgi:hypothetical protein